MAYPIPEAVLDELADFVAGGHCGAVRECAKDTFPHVGGAVA